MIKKYIADKGSALKQIIHILKNVKSDRVEVFYLDRDGITISTAGIAILDSEEVLDIFGEGWLGFYAIGANFGAYLGDLDIVTSAQYIQEVIDDMLPTR